MSNVKVPAKNKGFVVSRDTATGRFANGISVPGMGKVRIVNGESYATAKSVAGNRLRSAIENTGVRKSK
ncbi:hypothetical protein [Consotaella aegiceratis]|uniref:hypothetical protein n=1 Tax=Consotaella aegiceratis TaxID=3097961 RepID=UPI002F3E8E88